MSTYCRIKRTSRYSRIPNIMRNRGELANLGKRIHATALRYFSSHSAGYACNSAASGSQGRKCQYTRRRWEYATTLRNQQRTYRRRKISFAVQKNEDKHRKQKRPYSTRLGGS